jgi:chromosomal replication initiation ATPase DnaA
VELTHEIQQIRARRRRHWPRIGSRLQKSKITRIQSAVSSSFGFTLADLLGDSLAQPLATVRGIAMALCTELPGASLPLIGEAFHRHHTTVLHAKQVLRFRMEDPRIAAVVKAVRSQRSTALK